VNDICASRGFFRANMPKIGYNYKHLQKVISFSAKKWGAWPEERLGAAFALGYS
jgi:hypothetical protein